MLHTQLCVSPLLKALHGAVSDPPHGAIAAGVPEPAALAAGVVGKDVLPRVPKYFILQRLAAASPARGRTCLASVHGAGRI